MIIKVTKQDKKNIEKAILYINECADYIDMLKGCHDGEPSWKPNVINACDTSIKWLDKIIKSK